MAEIVLRTGQSVAVHGTAVVLPKAAKKGNLLVACLGANVAASALALPGFTLDTSIDQGSGTSSVGVLRKLAAGGEQTITASLAGATLIDLHVFEFAVPASTPLDQVKTATSTGSSVSTLGTGNTGTTTAAVELLVACCHTGNTHTAGTVGAPWTLGGDTAQLISAFRQVTTTGVQAATFSWTTARVAKAVLATYRGGVGVRVRVSGAWSDPIAPLTRSGGSWI